MGKHKRESIDSDIGTLDARSPMKPSAKKRPRTSGSFVMDKASCSTGISMSPAVALSETGSLLNPSASGQSVAVRNEVNSQVIAGHDKMSTQVVANYDAVTIRGELKNESLAILGGMKTTVIAINAEIEALAGHMGKFAQEIEKHEIEIKTSNLEMETQHHSKTILDHSGQIANIKKMIETQRQELQRLVEAFKSESSETENVPDKEDAPTIGSQAQSETKFVATLEADGDKKLSKEEIKFCRNFIRNYVGGDRVNDDLRGLLCPESRDKEVAKVLKLIPCFLTKPYTGTVYRGANHNNAFFSKLKFLLAEPEKHGPIYYQDRGFLSTSATEFEMQEVAEFGKLANTHFVIESLTGRHIQKYSQKKKENEVLFLPCTRFEITKCEVVGEKHVIHMREVPK